MKLADLIDTQMKALNALEQRMAAKPSRDLAEKLGKATLEAKAGRIEQRIVRLERHRQTAIARIDASLASEQAALAAVRQMAAAAPDGKPPNARHARPQPARARPAEPEGARRKRTTAPTAKAKPAAKKG